MSKNKAENEKAITAAEKTVAKVKKTVKKVAEVITDSIEKGIAYCTLNSAGREELMLMFNLAYDNFNSYVGENNISVSALNESRAVASDVSYAFIASETELETGFYLSKGKGGLQGGSCEKLDCGELGVWFRHSNGGVIRSDAFTGFEFISRSEILKRAKDQKDLRQFIVTEQESGKQHLYAGALLGDMKEKRQVLIVPTGDENGLKAVCLTTGKIGASEKADQAVQAGALSENDKTTLAMSLFAGADVHKGKQIAKNAKRKARKLALGS